MVKTTESSLEPNVNELEIIPRTREPPLSLREKIIEEVNTRREFYEHNIKPVGKTLLFDDDRAGVILCDNGLPHGSKERHIIWENERKRR